MEIIDRANSAIVLWKLLTIELKLEKNAQLLSFGEKFTNLQKDARTYEAELAEHFKQGVQKDFEKDQQKQAQQLEEVDAQIEIQRKKFRSEANGIHS